MKKQLLLTVIFALAMMCGAQTPWNGTVAESYDGGDGTSANPYQIATAEQLAFLSQQTNNGIGGNAYYLLTNDIILNDGDSLLWTPIGNIGAFTGVFDGNNHKIIGLYENGNKISGLFAVTENATIKSLRIENATVLEYEQAFVYLAFGGILIGKAINTNVIDCSVDGIIEIFSAVSNGGIIGRCDVDIDESDTIFIKNCINYAEVHDNERCGGIVGKTNVDNGKLVIKGCENHGYVNGWTFAGGMVGEGDYNITNCDNYGEIVSEGTAGGMVGQGGSDCKITCCFNHESGKITGGMNTGGIIGTAIFTTMSCCGNEALLTGINDDEIMIGGISGADGTIYNCYNRGDMTAVFTSSDPFLIQIGGIASTPPSNGPVRNVYNTGTIIKPSNPNIPSALYSHIVPATLSDTLIANCYWIGNETITPYIYNIETSSWSLIPCSSRFNQGATATSWVLDEAQYGTTDLLEALNAGAMGECVWVEDTEGVNDGYPIPIPIYYDGIEEVPDNDVELAFAYPNPGHNSLNIQTDLQNAEIIVYDVFGRIIHNQQITDNVTTINTTYWSSGTYMWKVVVDGKQAESGKWIKE